MTKFSAAAWNDTYAAEDFDQAVEAVIAATDTAADKASPTLQWQMHRAFTHAMQLEWMFWDSAYGELAWPVG